MNRPKKLLLFLLSSMSSACQRTLYLHQGRAIVSRSTVYDTNNKKNVRASLVGAPNNIHPLTVGAGSACPEHTHKNEYNNRRGTHMGCPYAKQ